MEDVLAGVDLLLLPTIPVEAPLAAGADTVETTAAVVPYTFVLAFARVPALSIPCGTTANGAPVGAQLASGRIDAHHLVRGQRQCEHTRRARRLGATTEGCRLGSGVGRRRLAQAA